MPTQQGEDLHECAGKFVVDNVSLVNAFHYYACMQKNTLGCEQVVLSVYDELTPNLYSEECVDSDGDNPCHYAAIYGFTMFCKQILAKGYI